MEDLLFRWKIIMKDLIAYINKNFPLISKFFTCSSSSSFRVSSTFNFFKALFWWKSIKYDWTTQLPYSRTHISCVLRYRKSCTHQISRRLFARWKQASMAFLAYCNLKKLCHLLLGKSVYTGFRNYALTSVWAGCESHLEWATDRTQNIDEGSHIALALCFKMHRDINKRSIGICRCLNLMLTERSFWGAWTMFHR